MSDDRFMIEDGVLLRYAGEASDRLLLPEGITGIGVFALAHQVSLTEVVLPEGVTFIGECAFEECSSLERIVLPSTLREIGGEAFRRCESLKEVIIPGGVRVIPNSCFSDCVSLKRVCLPEGVVSVEKRAFSGCVSIKSMELREGLREIGGFAFDLCAELRTVVLPEGVKRIERGAFSGCRRLRDITVPRSVTEIGHSAFYNTAFVVESEEDFVTAGDGILIACKCGSETAEVPAGTKTIGELAFAYSEDIRRVILPEGVTSICERAFESCRALEEVILPRSLRSIGDRAFEDCDRLESIDLPEDIRYIGVGAFDRTPLTYRDGTLILSGRYCIRYSGTEETAELPPEVRLIAGGAFKGNGYIRRLDLGGAEQICGMAFRWCGGLEEVYIPERVSYIGSYAFSSCDILHVTLERARRLVGEGAFQTGQRLTFTDGEDSFTVALLNDLERGTPEHALMGFAAEPSESRFSQLYYAEYMIPAAVCYSGRGGVYTEYLRANAATAVNFASELRDSDMLARLLELDILSERQAAECAAFAIGENAIEQQLMIMRYKQQRFGSVTGSAIDDKFDW